MFAVPAALVVAAVIIFPWFFTLFMSVHEWKVSGNVYYVGLTNYLHLLRDQRFLWAVRVRCTLPPHRSSCRW